MPSFSRVINANSQTRKHQNILHLCNFYFLIKTWFLRMRTGAKISAFQRLVLSWAQLRIPDQTCLFQFKNSCWYQKMWICNFCFSFLLFIYFFFLENFYVERKGDKFVGCLFNFLSIYSFMSTALSISCDGRVVKALDLKSNGIFPRRFEPCSQRILFLFAIYYFFFFTLFFSYTTLFTSKHIWLQWKKKNHLQIPIFQNDTTRFSSETQLIQLVEANLWKSNIPSAFRC